MSGFTGKPQAPATTIVHMDVNPSVVLPVIEELVGRPRHRARRGAGLRAAPAPRHAPLPGDGGSGAARRDRGGCRLSDREPVVRLLRGP
jgi:hypothetical protein